MCRLSSSSSNPSRFCSRSSFCVLEKGMCFNNLADVLLRFLPTRIKCEQNTANMRTASGNSPSDDGTVIVIGGVSKYSQQQEEKGKNGHNNNQPFYSRLNLLIIGISNFTRKMPWPLGFPPASPMKKMGRRGSGGALFGSPKLSAGAASDEGGYSSDGAVSTKKREIRARLKSKQREGQPSPSRTARPISPSPTRKSPSPSPTRTKPRSSGLPRKNISSSSTASTRSSRTSPSPTRTRPQSSGRPRKSMSSTSTSSRSSGTSPSPSRTKPKRSERPHKKSPARTRRASPSPSRTKTRSSELPNMKSPKRNRASPSPSRTRAISSDRQSRKSMQRRPSIDDNTVFNISSNHSRRKSTVQRRSSTNKRGGGDGIDSSSNHSRTQRRPSLVGRKTDDGLDGVSNHSTRSVHCRKSNDVNRYRRSGSKRLSQSDHIGTYSTPTMDTSSYHYSSDGGEDDNSFVMEVEHVVDENKRSTSIDPASAQSKTNQRTYAECTQNLAEEVRYHAVLKDRISRFKTYRQCFVSEEVIDYFIESGKVHTRIDGIKLGRELQERRLFRSACENNPQFKDERAFFEFLDPSEFVAVEDATDIPISSCKTSNDSLSMSRSCHNSGRSRKLEREEERERRHRSLSAGRHKGNEVRPTTSSTSVRVDDALFKKIADTEERELKLLEENVALQHENKKALLKAETLQHELNEEKQRNSRLAQEKDDSMESFNGRGIVKGGSAQQVNLLQKQIDALQEENRRLKDTLADAKKCDDKSGGTSHGMVEEKELEETAENINSMSRSQLIEALFQTKAMVRHKDATIASQKMKLREQDDAIAHLIGELSEHKLASASAKSLGSTPASPFSLGKIRGSWGNLRNLEESS